MNIELARTFLEVVAAGSMSVAAERLNVTHSTVTVRIRTLEDILRRPVLERSRSGVSLTADGVRFMEFAEGMVRTWQMTRRHMSLASGFEGTLSIGVDPCLWDGWMRDWVYHTRKSKPKIAIRCERDSSKRLVQRLIEGWLDICFVYETQTKSGFKTDRLIDDPLILVSTEPRDPMPWDPHHIAVDYGSDAKHQEDLHWGEIDETPHLVVSDISLGLDFLKDFGGSILIPQRRFQKGDVPVPLYQVPNQPVITRTAYMYYSAEALKTRLPRLSPKQIRSSVLKQLDGVEDIWAD